MRAFEQFCILLMNCQVVYLKEIMGKNLKYNK